MKHLLGRNIRAYAPGEGIAFDDVTISYVLPLVTGKKVLDLGCVMHNPDNEKSPIWLHKAIKSKAEYCVGLDLYEDGVKDLVKKGYNIIHGDAEQFDLAEKFDVVVVGDLIEHLSNPGKMLECCRKHIANAGVMLIMTPNPWYWRFIVKNLLYGHAEPNPEHTSWFCIVTIRTLLARHGWKIESHEYRSKPVIDKYIPVPEIIRKGSLFLTARPL